MRTLVIICGLLICLGLSGSGAPAISHQAPSALSLLDRYFDGKYDAVVSALSGVQTFDELLEQLKRDGVAWVDSPEGSERRRRELVAATVALEAAYVGEKKRWSDEQALSMDGYTYLINYWEAHAKLHEWACELLRRNAEPSAAERWWQLAANALTQKAEDEEFLYGDVNFPGRYARTTMISPTIKIEHLRHLRERFPDEPRFELAEPIALEWIPTARD